MLAQNAQDYFQFSKKITILRQSTTFFALTEPVLAEDLKVGIGYAARQHPPKLAVALPSADFCADIIVFISFPQRSASIATPETVCIGSHSAYERNSKPDHAAEEHLQAIKIFISSYDSNLKT